MANYYEIGFKARANGYVVAKDEDEARRISRRLARAHSFDADCGETYSQCSGMALCYHIENSEPDSVTLVEKNTSLIVPGMRVQVARIGGVNDCEEDGYVHGPFVGVVLGQDDPIDGHWNVLVIRHDESPARAAEYSIAMADLAALGE